MHHAKTGNLDSLDARRYSLHGQSFGASRTGSEPWRAGPSGGAGGRRQGRLRSRSPASDDRGRETGDAPSRSVPADDHVERTGGGLLLTRSVLKLRTHIPPRYSTRGRAAKGRRTRICEITGRSSLRLPQSWALFRSRAPSHARSGATPARHGPRPSRTRPDT